MSTPPIRCRWDNLDDQIDLGMPAASCPNTPTHTTCDPIGGVVCAIHKCRCSKPLAAPDTAAEEIEPNTRSPR